MVIAFHVSTHNIHRTNLLETCSLANYPEEEYLTQRVSFQGLFDRKRTTIIGGYKQIIWLGVDASCRCKRVPKFNGRVPVGEASLSVLEYMAGPVCLPR